MLHHNLPNNEISAFIGQEAMHSKEHLAFNASAQAYGYDVRHMEFTKNCSPSGKRADNAVIKCVNAAS
jgi:predicted metal-dependent hydrolase